MLVDIKTSNNPPVAVDDVLTTRIDVAKTVNVLSNDTDPDFESVHVSSTTAPAHGTVSCQPVGDCLYTPATGYTGPDSFTYTITDGLASAVATVTVTVTPNSVPVVVEDNATTKHDVTVIIPVLQNDIDPDQDPLSVVAHTSAAHGTASCEPGFCVYTPDTGFVDTDSFTYTASDGRDSATATVTVTVRPNAPPHAEDVNVQAVRGVDTPIPVVNSASDADGDTLTIVASTAATHGTVTCNTITCSYISDAAFIGTDGFDYTVSDGEATRARTSRSRCGGRATRRCVSTTARSCSPSSRKVI